MLDRTEKIVEVEEWSEKIKRYKFQVKIGRKVYKLAGSNEPVSSISISAQQLEAKAKRRAEKKARKLARRAEMQRLGLLPSPPKPKKFVSGSSSKGVNAWAKSMRDNPTPAEQRLQKHAKALGYYINAQAVFGDPRIGQRIVDVLITHKGYEIALEADGAQHFTPEGIEADRIRAKFFTRYYPAVKFLRYRNYEIKRDGFIDRLGRDLNAIVGAVAPLPQCPPLTA